jgi:bifunctional DNA-binding transcriptional regulator/antitoxin component of YhaV-PrlF toxin-antitoxin module
MSTPDQVGEGTVSGNQVSIPAHIRDQFDIEDGDVLRWKIIDDELRVEVYSQESGVFDDFDPGESDEAVDVVEEHDRFGLE